MFRLLFFLFLIVPLIEVALLIQIGQQFGAMYTLVLIIGTAVLGTFLFRQQGLSTLAKVSQSLEAGNLPATELIEGLMLLIAGALLLTPGFFTDMIGFLVLIPSLRNRIAQSLLINFLQSRIVNVQRTDAKPVIDAEHWDSE